jgi:hypothetical protein
MLVGVRRGQKHDLEFNSRHDRIRSPDHCGHHLCHLALSNDRSQQTAVSPATRPSVDHPGSGGHLSVLFCRSSVHVRFARGYVDASSDGVDGHSPSEYQLARRSVRHDRHLQRIYRTQAHTNRAGRKERASRRAVVQIGQIPAGPIVQFDLHRRTQRPSGRQAEEADDLLLGHRQFHRDRRQPRIRGANKPAQSIPDRNVQDRDQSRRYYRQVSGGRDHGVLRRSREPRQQGGRHRLRQDGDRHAAAAARATVQLAGSRLRKTIPAARRDQHRLLHPSAISAARTEWTTPSLATR